MKISKLFNKEAKQTHNKHTGGKRLVRGKRDNVNSGNVVLDDPTSLKIAWNAVSGKNYESDSDSDFESVEFGASAPIDAAEPPKPLTNGGKVKNDPEATKRVEMRMTKLVSDFSAGLRQMKKLLKIADGKLQKGGDDGKDRQRVLSNHSFVNKKRK